MKVLVISVTCGQGHNSTAKAILKPLKAAGIECEMLDAFEHINKILAKVLDDGYQLSTKHISELYSRLYQYSEHRTKNAEDATSVRLLNTILASKLRDYLEEYDPDVIVTTHCFAAAMIDILKQKGILHSINIGIVTDFTVHPFWEESIHFDYLVLPNEMLAYQARRKGFTNEKLLPFGIPIDQKFSKESPSKAESRSLLGLNRSLFTILVMSGSMGYGNIEDTVRELDNLRQPFQALVVCGSNLEMKEKIERLSTKNRFVVHGFVSNINEMMDAADCIITKPGGLTSSEALAKSLPMILVNPIPGQEERNVEFLLNNGAAMASSDTLPLCEILEQVMTHHEQLNRMREAVALIRHPDSTEKLCSFIIGLNT